MLVLPHLHITLVTNNWSAVACCEPRVEYGCKCTILLFLTKSFLRIVYFLNNRPEVPKKTFIL